MFHRFKSFQFQTIALVPFLNHLAETYFQEDDVPDLAEKVRYKSVRKVLASLVEIERIMYHEGMFLTDDAKTKFQDAFNRMGRHWQLLRHRASLAGINAWQVTPKVHIAMHFPMQSRLINPRAVQSYAEEGKWWRRGRDGGGEVRAALS